MAQLSLDWDTLKGAYPMRPIKMIIPFAPGGASDFVGRIISNRLGEILGQQIVIENRAGAAGNIGMETAAKSPADGYTLYLGNIGTLAINPALYANLAVNPLKDFAPVTLVSDMPSALVANNDLPVGSVKELITLLKSQPGKYNFASPGSGSLNRLEMELFRKTNGIDMVHVPYKGGGPAYAGLLGGEIQVLLDTMPGPQQYVRAGTLRALAVTGPKRLSTLPEVPTFLEQGQDGVDVQFMFGIVAPKGTPADIIARLNAETTQALADPEIRATLAGQSIEPTPGTPEAFGALLALEWKRWREIVAKTGFKAN